MKKRAIRVPLESYLYLHNEMGKQRSGREMSEKYKQHLEKQFERYYAEVGGHLLTDGDLGGAIGKPENSYEEHRWTSWSVDDMKAMLDKQGLKYNDNEFVDQIDVYI